MASHRLCLREEVELNRLIENCITCSWYLKALKVIQWHPEIFFPSFSLSFFLSHTRTLLNTHVDSHASNRPDRWHPLKSKCGAVPCVTIFWSHLLFTLISAKMSVHYLYIFFLLLMVTTQWWPFLSHSFSCTFYVVTIVFTSEGDTKGSAGTCAPDGFKDVGKLKSAARVFELEYILMLNREATVPLQLGQSCRWIPDGTLKVGTLDGRVEIVPLWKS